MKPLPHPLLPALAALCTLVCRQAPAAPAHGLVLPFREVSVASPVQEIIREVAVEEGDAVEQGQLLARLADEKETLDVEQYEKLIERREFEAKGAEALLKDRMTSQDAALEKKTELEMARIQHAIAVERLKEKSIRAPLSAIVVKKHKESGEAVDRVEPLIDLVNIDKVYIQFYLDPSLLPRLREGQEFEVSIQTGEGAETRRAAISFVDPRIDAASGLFRVKLLLDNPDHRIKAGMRAEADFAPDVPATGN
jgi:RND family efflux transporter MFP subunit